MLLLQCITFVLVALFHRALCLDAGLSAYEKASFSVPFDCDLCTPKFNHFAIHNTTGDIYLGSSNYLVHLNSAFQERQKISTFVPSCDDNVLGEKTDREDCINHNKLLAIYYSGDALITCGNQNYGKCQIRDTSDISSSTDEKFSIVAPGELPTEYVIAPASRRIDQRNTVSEDRLYVAATDPDNRRVPLYTRRSLVEVEHLYEGFLVANNDNSLSLSILTPTNFAVNYMDVFTYDKFTYFATNQRFDYLSNGPNRYQEIVSKLNRACHDSPNLDSYTEVVIECKGINGDVYNLIRAVHLDTVGPDLADSIGGEPDKMVLIGLFTKSVEPAYYTPDTTSAICIFNMDDIEMRFVDALKACLEGGQQYGVNYLLGKSCENVS